MNRLVLLTGATGYIGGHLLQTLQRQGIKVRCLVRDPSRLQAPLARTTELFTGDVMDSVDLASAMREVTHAYYLIHSMEGGADFSAQDRSAALNFASAARSGGVRRIIYLGGLGAGANLSPHLASRQEVGEILRESGVPTIEFRAAVVIGSGSVSFEMIRSLVERLPVMVTPRWVRVKTQPIAIEDVVHYLVAALDVDLNGSMVFEIGGADEVSYGELMAEYARQRGLRRLMIPVPVLTPRLSSLWLTLVTPVYARVGRALIESLRHETLVRDERARNVFGLYPMGVREAMRRALEKEDEEYSSTRWSKVFAGSRISSGRRFVNSSVVRLERPPETVFPLIESIGGATGWYHADWLWRLRGAIDLALGGVGLRRGRVHPSRLKVGDKVDFWRVEAIEPDKLLLLAAEMKLPGRAWLQFELDAEGTRATLLRTTAIFDPVGLLGLAYWYLLFPLHSYVFSGLLRGIRMKLEDRPRRPVQ